MADDALEPITLEEAKLNLRVDGFEEDDYIIGLIMAAREHVEDYTGLVLTPRTITETARDLGSGLTLSSWPIVSIDAIRYPVSGVMTPLAAGSWLGSLAARPARALPVTPGWGVGVSPFRPGFRTGLPVEIDVRAGYQSRTDVPAAVKQAIYLLVAHFYANRAAAEVGQRAAAIELPFGVTSLLRRWRLRTI